MLVLTLLPAIAVLIGQSASINLTYIVKKEGDKLQPNCIAEENERYAAIGWIYPLPEKEEQEPNITTKLIPTVRNEFNCKFSKRDKCNNIWKIKNWEIDENSARTLDLIFDSRWEDLPVVFTGKNSKEFKARFEIPSVFHAGFSVRAYGNVEVLICEGWNPYNYPCYHLNIGKTEIFLRKYMTLPKTINDDDRVVDYYKTFANILSGDEWRNFIISLNDKGVLRLNDVSVNRTVIQYEDDEVLKPLYLLTRSVEPALWKLHQNQFMYTTTPQISRLGPILNIASKSLCVALYVRTCDSCAMSFFWMKHTEKIKDEKTKNSEKIILKDVEAVKDVGWRLVKLKDENVPTDKLNIFVETKFSSQSENVTGFWAIDDVRVCHENEVKVSFLKLKENVTEDDHVADEISCQVVRHPNWRPEKLVYSKINSFPTIESVSNSTSITLNWTQEDPNNKINYFVAYKANDICTTEPLNLKRTKSNGFLRTKHNEITINNLVPYTKYNITFSTVLHEIEEEIFVTTLESELPTPEELPSGLQIHVNDTQASISWNAINCMFQYGHIMYAIRVTNVPLNISKELAIQTENSVQISQLEPFTLYTLHIITSRKFEDIQNNKKETEMSFNFTTQAGRAPPARNLEVYSIQPKTVSFRYDLPKNSRGQPVEIQVTRCASISYVKCKTVNSPITACRFWPNKYCLDVENLIPYQLYNFKVSVRNANTVLWGEEARINASTGELAPGAPYNVSYKVVDCKDSLDYCHLNISWLHPYTQNGNITFFNIVLNETDKSESKNIQKMLKIVNGTYLPRYDYQIQYIPYSTHYELYVQAANEKYRSVFAHTHVKTSDIGQHIDQNPKLISTDSVSVVFEPPPLDHRLKFYSFTVVVQDFNSNQSVPKTVFSNKKAAKNLCHNFGNTWILPVLEIKTRHSDNLVIGTSDENNKFLTPDTQYCFTFIVTNRYRNSEHDVIYYKKLKTLKAVPTAASVTDNSYKHLYALLLLLLVPVGFLAYRYWKKRRPKETQQQNKENVYESLPFEECENNCVNNETYDKLLHK